MLLRCETPYPDPYKYNLNYFGPKFISNQVAGKRPHPEKAFFFLAALGSKGRWCWRAV